MIFKKTLKKMYENDVHCLEKAVQSNYRPWLFPDYTIAIAIVAGQLACMVS